MNRFASYEAPQTAAEPFFMRLAGLFDGAVLAASAQRKSQRKRTDPYSGLGESKPSEAQKAPSPILTPIEMKSLPTLKGYIGGEGIKMQVETLAEEFAMHVHANPRITSDPRLRANADSYFKRYNGGRRTDHPMFNILFEGISGTGKTTLMGAFARQVQEELQGVTLKVWKVNSGLIRNSLVGESEKNIASMFETIKNGPQPCFVMIDEYDVIAATNTFGVQETTRNIANLMKDGIIQLNNLKTCIVATATNNIDIIDPALKAPHRTRVISVGAPSPEDKIEMLEHVLDGIARDTGMKIGKIPESYIEEQARNLQNGRATGASFEAIGRMVREARTGLLQSIERGRVPVIIQKKAGGKTVDVLLRPMKMDGRTQLPANVDEARGRFCIDASTGNPPDKYGLVIKHNGDALTSVAMTELTVPFLDFALANFERSRSAT